MKKTTFLLAVLFTTFANLQAQVKLKGIVTLKTKKKVNVEYQRTSKILADTLFRTNYSVFITAAEVSYEVEVNHNPIKKLIRVSCKDLKASIATNLPNIDYKLSNSGLVFNNESYLDTAINFTKSYGYFVFFQDTGRLYVNVNSITLDDSTTIILDKISKQVLNEHSKISYGLLQNPALVKSIQRNEKMLTKRISVLEECALESSKKIESLNSTSNNMIEDLMKCRNTNELMSKNYDSLTSKVYSLVNFSNSYPTSNKPVWDKLMDSLIYVHCSDYYFENTDIKYVIKVTTDTSGNVVSTDLVFPASVSALSSKDNYLFSMLCGMIKKVAYPTNKVDVYGKSYSVKSFMEKDIFISIKNRKDKIVFTDKDNMIFNDTKLPLTEDMKIQVNSKLYVGARPGKYGIKVCSFTINEKVKELVKELEF